MQVFIHTEGREEPELVEVHDTMLVSELLVFGDARGSEILMIEEVDEPLDLDVTVSAAGIRHRHHVHRGRCHRIAVRVRYNGDKTDEFRPTATVRRVFDWATGEDGFDLTPEQKATHVLALPDADYYLDWDVRIVTLITAGTCDLVLDLTPKERFEG